MDTYISYSRVNKHTNRWQKKVNQETKKPRNLLDLDRSTTHRHSTRYSLIDRHFRSHEHRNLWSRFFVSSFPSPRTHFSFLIGGRWRRKIGEISPSNFSTDDQPTLLPPRDGEVLRQGTERPMNTNQRGGRLFNYKPSSTDVSNFPRRLPSIFATAGGERRGRGGINDRLRNFSGKVRRVSTHRDEWTVCNSDCGESFSFRARLFCNQAMRDPRVGEIGMGEKRAKRFADFSFFGGTCFF